ncbi:LysR family transcriptional regulator [Burkholderia cenocepacia]|uniref:LysR family transcriptional regulator n=2 Tax=Burkholderia cenocepacia TaxID=95486 RepID=UPI00097BD4BC|nr:LysR family transcriptional regulator [Burkholderia cenocepacia]AQQ21382.1 LysR family transcriptional regulator [Burkholderia cenocepacia]AQQ47111.1 LysR family transcriptional regulator [Burkholderia cenocepacia]MBR8261747.1 LysR family transcriptional regulator [Burkholderia cenocepacia]MCW3539188.1 LysR family transcriptional regulator [Burkholderia cenocepacia]MCW3692412.1 LysR family transcriptional regulator [Burkholderia cenocepacia]
MEFLNDMALFVEVVKAKSFRRASEAIGVPNSTLSRRISALEKAIGLRLLHRTTRKIELTEAGQLYFERSRRIVDDARLAHEQLGEMLAQPVGALHASLPVDFANTFLAPLLAEFARRYPGITFDFDLTPRRVDLVTEPFDVAIRMGEPPSSNLIARELARLPRHLYASPRYIERFGEPREPTDLMRHECVRLNPAELNGWNLLRDKDVIEVAVGGRFLLNSVGMIRRLATLDFGIAVLTDEIAADDVATGMLRRVMPAWQCPPIPVYAITETRLLPAKTLRFIEFLKEHLGGPTGSHLASKA